jgi:hypothetical protein
MGMEMLVVNQLLVGMVLIGKYVSDANIEGILD